jgi:preprotein translocase subunit SecY
MPAVDREALRSFLEGNTLFGLLNVFSGGAMANFSIALMGVGPYITSSIIMQLLTMVFPQLEELQKEGEQGQRTINQYTRLLTVPLALLQSYAMISFLKSQGVVTTYTLTDLSLMLVGATAGTILIMWLGEIISENGIGNGISLIITLGIVADFPQSLLNVYNLIFGGGIIDWTKLIIYLVVAVAAVIVLALVVLVTEAERRIPVVYARRISGPRSYGSVETHLPLRVNAAGVIPIIFAISLLLFPGVIARFLSQARSVWLANFAQGIDFFLQNQAYYALLYFFLIIAFTYFYTSIVFRPDRIAENLQKRGGFIPGIRPGTETSTYLNFVMNRIILFGGLFLAGIAVLPYMMEGATGMQIVLGGTGLLITVAVIIETMRQIQAQLLTKQYDVY